MGFSGDFSEKSTSKFNSAMLEIQSMHESFEKCKRNSTKGNFDGWRWEMEAMWRKLKKDARRLEGENDDNPYFIRIKQLDSLISAAWKLRNRKLIYDALNDKEIFLSQLWEDSGKGGSYDDDEDDID